MTKQKQNKQPAPVEEQAPVEQPPVEEQAPVEAKKGVFVCKGKAVRVNKKGFKIRSDGEQILPGELSEESIKVLVERGVLEVF
jgi:hypothetical protein